MPFKAKPEVELASPLPPMALAPPLLALAAPAPLVPVLPARRGGPLDALSFFATECINGGGDDIICGVLPVESALPLCAEVVPYVLPSALTFFTCLTLRLPIIVDGRLLSRKVGTNIGTDLVVSPASMTVIRQCS